MKQNKLTVFGQDPNLVRALIIKTEDEAWELLENLQKDSYEAPNDIVIGDWCRLELHLQGKIWDSTITPSLFPVFQSLQKIAYHAYAFAKYGDKNKKLSNQEKDALEVIIRVTGGSSNQSSGLDLIEIAKAYVDKMDGKQALIGVLLIALAYGSTTIHKNSVESAKEVRLAELNLQDKQVFIKALLEDHKFASEQEIKKMELFNRAMQRSEMVRPIEKEIDNLHFNMLKSATKAEESTISGVHLEKELAKELVKGIRVSPKPVQINGIFQVLKLSWGTPHQITLKKLDDNLIIKANFDLSWLSEESKRIIKNAEWEENGNKLLVADINARMSKDKIVNAELIRVKHINDANDAAPIIKRH